MRFGRKTVLDTDPPKKIRGRKDLTYHPKYDYARTSMSFTPKGGYEKMFGEGYSEKEFDNREWSDFYNSDDYYEYDMNLSNPDTELMDVVRDNLREYYREYPGTSKVSVVNENYQTKSFHGNKNSVADYPYFFTEGRDELGTTYGTFGGFGQKYPAFVVTDPEVNKPLDLPSKSYDYSRPNVLQPIDPLLKIYSRKLNQQTQEYIYETSEGIIRKKKGGDDERFYHQNRKAIEALRKRR